MTERSVPGLAPGDIIRLDHGSCRILDQRRLPGTTEWLTVADWRGMVDAIATLAVRGAPAIGVAGAMGVALAARHAPADPSAARREIEAACRGLRSARPTAVNLSWAVDRMARLVATYTGAIPQLADALADEARAIHAAEVDRCLAIGRHGRGLLHRGATILTHCNAGALATGGYGTALGIVRAAFADDPTISVIVDETRPLLQGSRLTAWELAREGIAHTLIADNMVGAMIAGGRVTHVVVGADRIAANGDVVNKIGTYTVAVVAREHGVPVIVAAPTTTLDLTVARGSDVEIEERAGDEIRALSLHDLPAAAADVPVVNPAFDVTPQHLVAAIVTEQGVHRPPYDRTLRLAWEAAATP